MYKKTKIFRENIENSHKFDILSKSDKYTNK